MLADFPIDSAQCGAFSKDLHLPATFLYELLDFIADQLPRWRDDPDRPTIVTAETELTEHLCDYLGSATRRSLGWDILQFRTEAADEQNKGRKTDIAPKPRGVTIWIDGRQYTHYNALLPIECKRLPTPKGNDRDDREYVFSQFSSTGGIQRFKEGHHGGKHSVGAMIGYVQEDALPDWDDRVRAWIKSLVEIGEAGWSELDLLEMMSHDEVRRIAMFSSSHQRTKGLSKIDLRHLWIQLN